MGDEGNLSMKKYVYLAGPIEGCSNHLILAYLPKEINARRHSYGTTFEIAWGYSMQKPVVIVSDDVHVQDHPLMDLSGALFWDLDEAIDYINVLLEPYDSNKAFNFKASVIN